MDRSPQHPYQVLLVGEYKIFAEGLRALLERAGIPVVGEASDARSATELAKSHKPGVAVLDISDPQLAIELVSAIRAASSETRTLVLSLFAEGPLVIQALRSGVQGYVLKTQSAADLICAIDDVSQGAVYISPVVAGNLVDVALGTGKPREEPLTPRERQVLKLVAEGQSTREIAAELSISFKTAEYHRHRIMRRLGIHETAGLVRYAIRRGVIQA